MSPVVRTPLHRGTPLHAGSAAALPLGWRHGGPDASHPHPFTLAITRCADGLETTVEPAGDIADGNQVHAGDIVDVAITNRADVPDGVHNHADDAERGERMLTLDATEAVTGGHELVGWIADEGHGGSHEAVATTPADIAGRPPGR